MAIPIMVACIFFAVISMVIAINFFISNQIWFGVGFAILSCIFIYGFISTLCFYIVPFIL